MAMAFQMMLLKPLLSHSLITIPKLLGIFLLEELLWSYLDNVWNNTFNVWVVWIATGELITTCKHGGITLPCFVHRYKTQREEQIKGAKRTGGSQNSDHGENSQV